MKNKPLYKKLTSGIFYFNILLFIIAFNFSDHGGGGWQLQTLPFLNDRPLTDMTFTDSLTGYGITGNGTVGDTNYIIKTFDGGNNWNIIFSVYRDLSRVIFINNLTGFVSGGFNSSGSYLIKTTNGGNTWTQINTPNALRINDMSVISEDSLWITSNFFTYSLFSSTNGGISWDLKFTTGNGIDKIYFDKNFGFLGNNFELWKTTNYGDNWLLIPGQNGFNDMYFIDSFKGWKSYDSMRVTTDGGYTWKRQYIITPGSPMYGSIATFSHIGNDTIWAGGLDLEFQNLQDRGVVHFTTNGGLNWFYQIPDTSYHLGVLYNVNFFNSSTGWLYSSSKGIQTKTGGDSIFYPITSIRYENNYITKDFALKQNYPNPFNPRTVIPFSLKKSAYVKLTAYDIRGVVIQKLAEGKYSAGEYEVDFMGKFSPSGVYFYKIEVTPDISGERFVDTKRMMLLK